MIAKVVPSLSIGDPPDYTPSAIKEERPVDTWRIRWNDLLIGSAASQSFPAADGGKELRSVVRCRDLPVREMSRELLGGMAMLVEPLFARMREQKLDFLVATRMYFNEDGRLTQIRSSIELGETVDLFRVHGTIDDQNRLRVVMKVGAGSNSHEFTQTIDLPSGALVNDSLAPRSDLRDLQIGKTWNVPVYRIFSPSQRVQLLRASVERHEVVFWDGRDVETMLVVYRSDPTSNVAAAREIVGREWIARDGRVLRQEASFGSVQLRFERTIDIVESAALLHADHLWQGDSQQQKGN